MNYDVQISFEDLKAAYRLHLRPRPAFKVMLMLLLVPIALAFFITARDFVLYGRYRGFFVFLVAALYFWFMFAVLLPRQWRRIYKQQRFGETPVHFEFTPDEIAASTPFGNSRFPWSRLHKWKEGPACFLLYHSDALFQLVPKRIFNSATEVDELRKILQQSIGNPAR